MKFRSRERSSNMQFNLKQMKLQSPNSYSCKQKETSPNHAEWAHLSSDDHVSNKALNCATTKWSGRRKPSQGLRQKGTRNGQDFEKRPNTKSFWDWKQPSTGPVTWHQGPFDSSHRRQKRIVHLYVSKYTSIYICSKDNFDPKKLYST